MKWRHAPTKLPKWFSAIALLRGAPSRRQVASCIGLMVWHNYMSQEVLLTIAPFLSICKLNSPVLGPRQQAKEKWNEGSTVSEDSREALAAAIEVIARSNPWQLGRQPPDMSEIACVASDASDDYGGWLRFTETGEVVLSSVKTVTWNQKMRPAHIFLKELLAAVLAIEHTISTLPKVRVIRIAVDNTAAGFCMRRMYSNNDEALKLLIRLNTKLGGRIVLDVVTVRGIDNAADCPSRKDPLEEHRNRAAWNQFLANVSGVGHVDCVVNKKQNTQSGQLRHDEEVDSGCIFLDALEELTEEIVEEINDEGNNSQPAAAFSDAEIAIYLTGSV